MTETKENTEQGGVDARGIANEIIIAVGKDPRYYPVTVSKAMTDIQSLLTASNERVKRETCEEILQKVGTILKPIVLSSHGMAEEMRYCDGRVSAVNEAIEIVSKVRDGKEGK